MSSFCWMLWAEHPEYRACSDGLICSCLQPGITLLHWVIMRQRSKKSRSIWWNNTGQNVKNQWLWIKECSSLHHSVLWEAGTPANLKETPETFFFFLREAYLVPPWAFVLRSIFWAAQDWFLLASKLPAELPLPKEDIMFTKVTTLSLSTPS